MEATSDEAGRYEMLIWAPGWYHLRLRAPSGAPVAGLTDLTAVVGGDHQVDFDLASSAFSGSVVDVAGAPVAGAWVSVRWPPVTMTGTSETDGSFSIDATAGAGTAILRAGKADYQTSDPIRVEVAAQDMPITPVTLVVRRQPTARGTLLTAGGIPVANAFVASVEASPESGPILYQTARSQADGSFEVGLPAGPATLYASGPGCPLFAFGAPAPPPAPDPTAADGGVAPPAPAMPCPEQAATLEITLIDAEGRPLPSSGVVLRRGDAVIPDQVLQAHLVQLGLPGRSDAAGHLVLANLAPGPYDLFLNMLFAGGMIALGQGGTSLGAVSLPPSATTEIQVAVPAAP